MVLLGCLGWNVDNPLLVQEDYSLVMENISSKIDIALFKELNESNPEIYIKVKNQGTLQDSTKEKEAELQLWEYDRYNRVKLIILTDGQIWHFYYPLVMGAYYDRKVYSLDFFTKTDKEIAYFLNLFLSSIHQS